MATSKDRSRGAIGPRESAGKEPPTGAPRGEPKRAKLRVKTIQGNVYSSVGYDAKGNPILEWRTDLPGRTDDETLRYLKALENDALELADDEGAGTSKREGYNPYDKRPK